ncbi:MAG: endonuclease III [Phycisphaerae bacterium]
MKKESPEHLRKRAGKIIGLLKKQYPDAATRLFHHSPMELLVATILSAQCTDDRVNIVTDTLFKKYKTPQDYANVPQDVLEGQVRSTGFFRNKAKNIRLAAAKIISDFGGKVPATMAELLTLPGVARKTANCVLGNAYKIAEGITVDTHVARLSIRLGFTDKKKPDAVGIEQDLMEIVPKDDWILVSHLLIYHGRATCTARKPDCAGCILNTLCPSAFRVDA